MGRSRTFRRSCQEKGRRILGSISEQTVPFFDEFRKLPVTVHVFLSYRVHPDIRQSVLWPKELSFRVPRKAIPAFTKELPGPPFLGQRISDGGLGTITDEIHEYIDDQKGEQIADDYRSPTTAPESLDVSSRDCSIKD